MKYSIPIILWFSLLLPGTASAITLGLGFGCVTGNDPDGNACAIGEAQLSVDIVSAANGGLDLSFMNVDSGLLLDNGSDPNPSVAEIYFDTSLLLLDSADLPTAPAGSFVLTHVSLTNGPGVSFTKGLASSLDPSNLPGGGTFDAVFGADSAAGNDNGIQEGEWLKMNISLLSLDTFLLALSNNDFGIGLHVRSFEGGGDDYSESFIAVSAVPVPAAFWLFGTALLGFIGYSRKRSI